PPSLPRGRARGERGPPQRHGGGDARLRGRGVGALALDADETPAQALGHRPGGAATAERVEHEIVGARGSENDPHQQRLRLLRGMQLFAVAAFETLLAGAERDGPVRAHLYVVVAGLERFVIEGVALAAGLRG